MHFVVTTENWVREFLHEIFFNPKLINNDFYHKENFSEVVFHFHQPPDHKLWNIFLLFLPLLLWESGGRLVRRKKLIMQQDMIWYSLTLNCEPLIDVIHEWINLKRLWWPLVFTKIKYEEEFHENLPIICCLSGCWAILVPAGQKHHVLLIISIAPCLLKIITR